MSAEINALVLGGGSIKGCFQAGAIKAVLEAGFQPQYIYGVSVGSLNGAFLTNGAGREQATAPAGTPVNWADAWPRIGRSIVEFWRQNITKPGDIIEKRGGTSLLFKVLFDDFKGLVKTERLRRIVEREINRDHLLDSPVRFESGVVNLTSGLYESVSALRGSIHEYIMASSAIPMMMPIETIAGQPYVDGGLRDVTPLRSAIDAGATRIVCIACQPEEIRPREFEQTNILSLLDRLMEILTHETVTNDIERFTEINRQLTTLTPESAAMLHPGKRHIPIKVIRPVATLDFDIARFTAKDIQEALDLGERTAKEMLKLAW